MIDLVETALDAAAAADYVDARWMGIDQEWLSAKHGRVDHAQRTAEEGLCVRALAGGAWGFAATSQVNRDGAARAAREALTNARAASRWRREPVTLAPEPVHVATWETPRRQDPFAITPAEKLDLLVAVSQCLEAYSGVVVGEAMTGFVTERQLFGSSEGSRIEQTIHFAGCGLTATSAGPGGIQKRSYPNSWGEFVCGGYELVESADLLGHAPAVAAECVALQSAELCPSGRFDLILEPKQLMLQIHESVGHPLELDRVLGIEANFAGTSFATPDLLGTLAYGSPLVNLTADATLPGGVGTFGYDDEGVAAQRWPLVTEGILCGYLTSREYAAAVGEERSRGAMRAEGWRHAPIVRMVNISLEPGRDPLTIEELIADTRHGILMDTNRSWSIDQKRVNFQFGCELAWEIRDGRRHRLLRDPTYQGLTTEFWGSCDAICDEREWRAWGVFNCGKGEPMQVAQMSHGSSPARFRQVNCGVR